MTSKIRFRYHPNGNLENITTDGDQIFQGQVATTEYHLSMAEANNENNWLPGDIVFINFERPDGMKGTVIMQYKPDTNEWVQTTNGWETDVDIVANNILKISFTMMRRRPLNAAEYSLKPTEAVEIPMQATANFTPYGISSSDADEILVLISQLQEYITQNLNFKITGDTYIVEPGTSTEFESERIETENGIEYRIRIPVSASLLIDQQARDIAQQALTASIENSEDITNNKEQISALQTSDATLNTRVTGVENKNVQQDAAIVNVNARVDALAGNIKYLGIANYTTDELAGTEGQRRLTLAAQEALNAMGLPPTLQNGYQMEDLDGVTWEYNGTVWLQKHPAGIVIDSVLDPNSKNPVENGVITGAITDLQDNKLDTALYNRYYRYYADTATYDAVLQQTTRRIDIAGLVDPQELVGKTIKIYASSAMSGKQIINIYGNVAGGTDLELKLAEPMWFPNDDVMIDTAPVNAIAEGQIYLVTITALTGANSVSVNYVNGGSGDSETALNAEAIISAVELAGTTTNNRIIQVGDGSRPYTYYNDKVLAVKGILIGATGLTTFTLNGTAMTRIFGIRYGSGTFAGSPTDPNWVFPNKVYFIHIRGLNGYLIDKYIPDATASIKGLVTLSDAINSSVSEVAASSAAVNAVNDKADNKVKYEDGTSTRNAETATFVVTTTDTGADLDINIDILEA